MKKQTLLFQGMGMNFYTDENVKHSDVGNFRIRTAFKDSNGKKVFFECGNGYRAKKEGYYLTVDFLFNITDDSTIDDCNYSKIEYDWIELRNNYKYTKNDILKFVNEKFGTDFKNLEVTSLGSDSYRVGNSTHGYNLMENFLSN